MINGTLLRNEGGGKCSNVVIFRGHQTEIRSNGCHELKANTFYVVVLTFNGMCVYL